MMRQTIYKTQTNRPRTLKLGGSIGGRIGRKSIYFTAMLMAVVTAVPSLAANPEHVNQLLQTGACMRCDLSGADLSDAHLIGADLREANLMGANLRGANIEGADLEGANLSNTVLVQTYLTNASLTKTNLANANMTNAIAYNADTRGSNMMNLTIVNAQIFGSGISIGGDEELPKP